MAAATKSETGDLMFVTSGSTPPEALALVRALLASGALSTVSQTQAPQSPAHSAEYQTLLNSIPIANDGDVIFPEHHNSLRAAIGVLARNLDDSAFARLAQIPFTPALLPNGTAKPWRLAIGAALGPDTGGSDHAANGWMPLDLPHGSRIEGFSVRGEQNDLPAVTGGSPQPAGSVGDWQVALARREVAGSEDVTLGSKDISGQAGAFSAPVEIAVEGATQAQMEGYRRIDNEKYQYLFTTAATSVNRSVIKLTAVEVTCSRW
jgi:hypothetical protein